jgi:hypothetical protein
VSSGHNTNRGRNSNNGGSGSNGGNNRRARRTLSHQRNPAAQSVFQHRADSASASAPARASEVSASLEQEDSLPTAADQVDLTGHQREALGVPVEPVPPDAGDPTNGDKESSSQSAAYPDRLDPSTGQQRTSRRSPQLIPSPSPPSVSTGVHAARDSASALNSIRAPFAPGHNHLHPGNNLRPAFPPVATDPTVSSDRRGAALPLRRPEEGASQFSESSWDSAPAKQANDDGGNEWPRFPTVPGHMGGNAYGDPGNHQEQGPSGGPVFFESRDVRGDIGELVDSLHEAFERDRGIASQGDSARCGICYLHYFLSELQYREEEGYYVCASCARALSHTRILMVRRQQRL